MKREDKMKTMDTIYSTHKKYRPPLSAAGFYQPDFYNRHSTLRTQSEYRFAGGGTLSARARSTCGTRNGGGGSRRARLCSAALAVAALVSALAVMAVAALAFYMGALRPDNADPIISFECSLRVTRGDVYGGGPGSAAWRERVRRYSAALRSVYSSAPAPLRAAFAGAHVTGFGDHRLDVYFRLYLDRRKIPSSVSNLEEMLKDTLVKDLQSKRLSFGQVKIDPTSIIIKRDLEHTYHSEFYMKQAINESMASSNLSQTNTKDKGGGSRMGVVRKTTLKPILPSKKRVSTNEEPEINTENLPVVQGTFQITKTEADITENNQNDGELKKFEKITPKISTTTKSPSTRKIYTTTVRPKPFTIRSTFNVKTKNDALTTSRINASDKTTLMTTTRDPITTTAASSTMATISTTTNEVSQLLLDLLTNENHDKDLPKIDTLFTAPHIINDEPWKPITQSSTYIHVTTTKPMQSNLGHTMSNEKDTNTSESKISEDSSTSNYAEHRIGVAEVVDDLSAIEGMLSNYPTVTSEINKPLLDSFPGIHNSDTNLAADIYVPKPVYTSFGHPTISPNLQDTEKLGSNFPKVHPIPVDKISSVVEDHVQINSSGFLEDDGKPVMRPPKDKLSTITINIIHPDVRAEATEIVDTEGGNIVKIVVNDTKLPEAISEILESRSDDNTFEGNTERYLKKNFTRSTTPFFIDKIVAPTSSPHFTWELVNSSTKGSETSNRNSIPKHFNDTLQAIITKNDGPFPNTTPKFANRISLLKNITDIIHRFTSALQDKNKQLTKPELRNDDNNPIENRESLEELITTSSNPPPIITLMPAKSNLGINRPLRPRPKNPNLRINDREDLRSFSKSENTFLPIKMKETNEHISQITSEQKLTTQNINPQITTIKPAITDEINVFPVEIITSASVLEMMPDIFFLTNVTETIKVIESANSSLQIANQTQERLRLPKTNSELGSVTKSVETTDNDKTSTKDNADYVAEVMNGFVTKPNIKTKELEYTSSTTFDEPATSIPEGTYKISYHVSGSVSTKASNRTKSLPTFKLPLEPDIILEIPLNQTHQLSVEKLKQLANLATISDAINNSYVQVENSPPEDIISHKAVSSSYTVNHAGFKMLTKTYNKAITTKDDEKNYNAFYNNVSHKEGNKKPPVKEKKDECNLTSSFRCESGECLPLTSKCNRLLDCSLGEDENTCSCADYLRSEFLASKLCDGIVDCWDFSDENKCEWCSPEQFVCANARQCIEKERVCDGTPDCPFGDDERACVTLSENLENNDVVVPYNNEGYLMVRKRGSWGRLCLQNFEKVIANARSTLQLDDLGRAVCKSMTFGESEWVRETREPRELALKDDEDENRRYWEIWHNARPRSGETRLSFRRATCPRRQALRVRCAGLDCGLRPFVDTQQARIVGGAGAAGGAWPWQAALYRDGDFQCGATLVAPDWLLSASHCFYQATEAHWVARLGALRRGAWPRGPWETTAPVTRVHLHPHYVARGFRNDIALLRIPRLRLHARLRPVCLPPPRTEPPPGTLCTVVGWGQLYEQGRVFPDTLQEVELPVISTVECKRRTLFLPLYKVTDDMFCAGYERGGRDACLGDSGGPLVCQEADNRWYLHGVTSNGYGCARANRPGVYTKVANYIDWIDSVVQQHSDDELNVADSLRALPDTPPNISDVSDLETSENKRMSRVDTCRGHRCPLGECLPPSSVCNGYLECSDGSDEVSCDHRT